MYTVDIVDLDCQFVVCNEFLEVMNIWLSQRGMNYCIVSKGKKIGAPLLLKKVTKLKSTCREEIHCTGLSTHLVSCIQHLQAHRALLCMYYSVWLLFSGGGGYQFFSLTYMKTGNLPRAKQQVKIEITRSGGVYVINA